MAETINLTPSRPLFRGTQIVLYILYVVDTLLIFRFLLKIIGANPAAGFTTFIYSASYPLVAPFIYVVRSFRFEETVIEWSTILAMIVYWVIAIGLIKLFAMSKPVTTGEAHHKLGMQDH